MNSHCIRCDYCGVIIKENEELMRFGNKDSCQLCKPFAFAIMMKEDNKK